MTENDKLCDAVLNQLLYIPTTGKRFLSIEDCLIAIDPNIESWQNDHIKKQLIGDGYVVERRLTSSGGQCELTSEGIKFIKQGGYQQESRDKELKTTLDLENLKAAKRSKYSLLISILALIVSAIAGLSQFLA